MDNSNPDLSAVIDTAGPIAGLFILLVAIALFFLMRSMSKQLKKVDPSLPNAPKPAVDADEPPAAGS